MSVYSNCTWGSPGSGPPERARGGHGVQAPARQWSRQSNNVSQRAAGSAPPLVSFQSRPAWQLLSPYLPQIKQSLWKNVFVSASGVLDDSAVHIWNEIALPKCPWIRFMLPTSHLISSEGATKAHTAIHFYEKNNNKIHCTGASQVWWRSWMTCQFTDMVQDAK